MPQPPTLQSRFKKYQTLFANDSNLKRAKKAFMAGKLVDVMFLKTNPALEVLERMVDGIIYFEFK